jgi:SAM-dependent methyltransferase
VAKMVRAVSRLLPTVFRERHRSTWLHINLVARIVLGKLRRFFYRPPLPKNLDGSVNLHLGCGNVNDPRFINIDLVPAAHIHYVRRIDDLSPFSDKSVDFIYASHCLEHIPYLRVPTVLSEWYRVLKDGGILRLSVPDFDLLLNIYCESGKDIEAIIMPLLGGQDSKYNIHFSVFTEASLNSSLKKAGFKEIRKWDSDGSSLTSLSDLSSVRAVIGDKTFPVCLNIEAVK